MRCREANIGAARCIKLETVLLRIGAVQDKHDSGKWHTNRGVISITGQKFMNWNKRFGGGGAIDLTMHLMEYDFKAALSWLSTNESFQSDVCLGHAKDVVEKPLTLPVREDSNMERIVSYLINKRHIPATLVQWCSRQGKLYADKNSNAVFLLFGKNNTIVGAELRGTSSRKWRGMAPGSKKGAGCFYVPASGSKKVVLCESAIDALSCFVLNPHYWAASTAGAQPNPPWLKKHIEKGYEIWCGYDADKEGDTNATVMMAQYPMIKRKRPPRQFHDWNDAIISMKGTDNKTQFFFQVAKSFKRAPKSSNLRINRNGETYF